MTDIRTHGLQLDFISLKYEEPRAFVETYGFAGSQGFVHIDAVLMHPEGHASETLFVFMHPTAAQHVLPVPRALAFQGCHVLCAQNRYFRNDTALIFEKTILDLGAHIRHAKEVLGYKKIVLVGWSGGGPLTTFYQSQAENPTITSTPAGDPVNIRDARLIPADALIFQAASISRAQILAEYIDPSVLDEANPDRRDASLDIYDPANTNQPPYSPAFIERYRAAQYARIRRITSWVKQQIAELKSRGSVELEQGFVTHRTMADPRWLDVTIDPNDRKAGMSFIGDPRSANNGPAGFARFSSLRSWLSQWSIDDSVANAEACVRNIRVPFLAIENSADDAAPTSHMKAVYNAAASPDKMLKVIEGANHYYTGRPELLEEACRLMMGWLRERKLLA